MENAQLIKKNKDASTVYGVFFALYFLSLPFNAISLGIFGSLLRYIGLIVLISWLIFSRKIRFNNILTYALILVFLYFLNLFYTIDSELTKSRLISETSFLLLMIAISGLEYNKENSELITKTAIWSSRITAILVIITAEFYRGTGRISLGGIFSEDPNHLTAYFLFGYVFAMFGLSKKNMLRNKVKYILEIVLYISIILTTGSRTGFIAYFVITILYLLFHKQLKFSSFVKFFIALSLLIITINLIDNDILSRFTLESILESEGTGRYQLWKDALHIFYNSTPSKLLFGYGTGTITTVYTTFGYKYAVAHNIFIEKLVENGIVGLILYVTFVISLIYTSFKIDKKHLFYILLGMIIVSFATSVSTFTPYWNVILMIIYFSKSIKHEKPPSISVLKSAK